MNYSAIRKAYLADQLTDGETAGKLIQLSPEGLPTWVLIESWDHIKGLHATLAKVREQQQSPRLGKVVVRDLIDHAFTTGYLSEERALRILLEEGMNEPHAVLHLETIKAIRDRDDERAAYLEDPDNAPRYCTRCGKETPKHKLSLRGICEPCSAAAIYQAVSNLMNKRGPVYRKWRDGMLKAMYKLETDLAQERKVTEATENTTWEELVKRKNLQWWREMVNSTSPPIDHDKAPPCQNDCYDCPDEECVSRVEPYVQPGVESTSEEWKCPDCQDFVPGTYDLCPFCYAPKPDY